MISESLRVLETVAPPLAAGVILVFLGFAIRRVFLFRRGREPSIQVSPFSWAAGEGDRESLWVTSLFREHLKELRLDGLDPVPDRAPGQPLVEIVEGVGQGVGPGMGLGKAMGRLYRAIVPDSAYEVWATLRPHGADEGAISIQLIKRAGGNKTLVSFTSEIADWETCAREAAMAAAGALYPHLATRYKGPWADWKKPVPADLLGFYQGALRHERGKRFEQALGEFRRTVEKDPLNPQLRLKVAMIEERLGLHLDAWFTYWAIVDESHRKTWRGPHRWARLVALYRLAIHLWNPGLIAQWVAAGKQSLNEAYGKDLGRLREELLSALQREDVFKGEESKPRSDGAARATAHELLGSLATEMGKTRAGLRGTVGDLDPSMEKRIKEVFQIISLSRLEELKGRMSRRRTRVDRKRRDRRLHRPPLRRWARRKELQPQTVEASERLVRAQVAQSIEVRLGAAQGKVPRVVASGHEELLRQWPFPGWDRRNPLSRQVRRARIWLGRRRRDAWQLHYNAACAIATQLPSDSIRVNRSEESEECWIEAAITQLESFSRYAGSSRMASKADWVAFEDPDLARLYEEPIFKLWGSQRLGFGLPTARPVRAADLERHTVLILKRSAAAFASSWHGRAGSASVSALDLLGWWKEERENWERLKRACDGHKSWRCRREVLEELEFWSAGGRTVAIDFGREERETWVKAKSLPEDLLRELGDAIGCEEDDGGKPLAWVADRAGQLTADRSWRLRPGSGALPTAERRAALEVAEVWSGLETVLDTALREPAAPNWDLLKRSNGHA